MFSPRFDVICDLLLNRRMATLNLFVLYSNEKLLIIFPIFYHNAKAGLCLACITIGVIFCVFLANRGESEASAKRELRARGGSLKKILAIFPSHATPVLQARLIKDEKKSHLT